MKNLSIVIALTVFGMNIKAQNDVDTIHKNEFSFNVLPVIITLGGGSAGSYSNFNLGYKRYFKNNFVLRTAFVFYPAVNSRNDDGLAQFSRTVDTLNVFQTRLGSGSRWQANLGFEKIVKSKRMMHGFGTDFWFTKENNSALNHSWWEPKSKNHIAGYQMYSNENYAKNVIDSLTYTSTEQKAGIGAQLFYSARFRISKRFYISSTFGPRFTVYSHKVNNSMHQKPANGPLKYTTMDFELLLSDISIAYRF